MRELVYYVAVTLDGRIASPTGEFDAFSFEGDSAAMIIEEWADTLPAPALAAMGLTAPRTTFSTVLMGWNTYAAGLPAFEDPYSHLEQIVFSRTRGADDVGSTVRLTDEDPRDVVAALKQQDGADIWLCGGGDLAGQLRDQIDRLVLKVNPVIFGDGRPLFGADYAVTPFDLERSRAFATGVVVNEYRRRAG